MTAVLKVENLRTQFRGERGLVKAVDGVSYDIREGETYRSAMSAMAIRWPVSGCRV